MCCSCTLDYACNFHQALYAYTPGTGFGDQKESVYVSSKEGQAARIASVSPTRLVLKAPPSSLQGAIDFILSVNKVLRSFQISYTDSAPVTVISVAEDYGQLMDGAEILHLPSAASTELLLTGSNFNWQDMTVSPFLKLMQILVPIPSPVLSESWNPGRLVGSQDDWCSILMAITD